jgi:hypothetical protein
MHAMQAAHPEWGALDYALFEEAPGGVSWYSCLLPWQVPDVDAALRAEYAAGPPRTITDATAHIGADSANLLKVFPRAALTAIEICPDVGAVLRRNAARVTRALGIQAEQFRVVNGDAALRPDEDFGELVYLDPPWAAGREALRLGATELPDFIRALLRAPGRTVIAKLPKETDLAALDARVGRPGVRYPVYDARKPRVGPPSYYMLAYRGRP